ncbi:TPR-like protein [Gymnopus androsaceus JB14]|uniref:TPR-like protein n=1 Tax=Gymnopus androsaceus JB14 TaxID=1447944 RepID=A0A6A4GWX7_9AGAR|nr:TPR-like protein [Gymnopus androsaceus JB14]
MERASSYSVHDEDESAELQYAINMSLEQPEAQTMSDMSLNAEDQEELEKALILSSLSSEEFDEVVSEQHLIKLMSVMERREEQTKWVQELDNAALQLARSFQQSGDISQIENAVQLWEQACELVPEGHADKPGLLSNLGAAYISRFNCLGELSDIESAIFALKQAVELTPDGHDDKPSWLNNLGNAYESRFGHLGELSDIESAIFALKQAVELTPDGHANKPGSLSNLGSAYESRFGHLGELSDIESAIFALKQAVELAPDGHADKPSMFHNLGNAYESRFGRLGELSDIESAICRKKQAVELTPDGHANKPSRLNNLGNAYESRFDHLGELSDIESAIFALKQAVELTPDGHADKPGRLSNLGIAYESRFGHLGELSDIERSIFALKQAVELTPDGHADKPSLLNNLGNAYQLRFGHLGELSDIESAIFALKQAVELTPDGHAGKPGSLSNLGSAYGSQFGHLGELSDIESAIFALKQAVELAPDGHADKPSLFHNLGAAYQSRFGHLGVLSDIESAICANKQAVELTPDGHAGKPGSLSNLGGAYESRFGHLGELSDIESAIFANKQAVELTPDGHADKPGRLNNLGNAYQSQFGRLGELSDIESAIFALKQAVELTPDGHANKPNRLNNLGNAYESRFGRLGELSDIESAIFALKQAVELTPDGHADKPSRLNNLGTAYESRFGCLGELSDIESAILANKQAVELTPDGHADKPGLLNNLGNAYESRFHHSHHEIDLDLALSSFQSASLPSVGKPVIQLKAAIKWSKLCSTPILAVQAFTRFFELIPQVVWLGQSVHRRYEELPYIGRAIGAAAATAISAGNQELAVEWLEEGRNIIWGQILQLRSPLDDLHHQYPKIAKELERVAQALQHAGTSTTRNNIENRDSEVKQLNLEEEAQNHRKMAFRYEELLQQIRALDGFTSFLKPKKLSELASAAKHGPVIVVNVDQNQCDALVLSLSRDIIHVPLPKFSLQMAQNLHIKLISSLHVNGIRIDRNGDRATRAASGENHDEFTLILKILWLNVVQPILSKIEDLLHESTEHIIPHITWCPTGPLTLLPLHAAGIYGGPMETNINISDFVVSSYTTTLRALISSGSKFKEHQANIPSVLIVSQPNTPGLSPLPGTVEEAKVIKKHTLGMHTCHLNHEAATAEAVMHEMGMYDFIHFACHGIQDVQDPLDSAFALYDQRLKLKDLMSLSLNNVHLAVLSACQTATGDEDLPEEAVHLAAGMLAVGYPSVIATLWSIGDKEAPLIADKVYANLLGHNSISGEKKSTMTPAYALHEATKNLRKEVGATNFVKWVPFIHLGV